MAVVPANTEIEGAQRCTNHPERETLVRCGRCVRPFCTECLIHTAAGQRCYECAGVRRDYAQRAAARTFLAAFGTFLVGAVVTSLIGGLWSLMVAAVAGGMAGQAISPTVNRRTRRYVYLASLLVLLAGATVGLAIVPTIRFTTRAGFDPLILVMVPLAVVQSGTFWLFVIVAGIAAYVRIR